MGAMKSENRNNCTQDALEVIAPALFGSKYMATKIITLKALHLHDCLC